MADYRMMILVALFAFLSGQGFSMDYSMTKRLAEDRECRSCNLEAGNLAGVQFINFDLSNANLANAHLEGSNLNNSNLAGVNLQGAHLFSASLEGCNLEGANLADVDLQGAGKDAI